MTTAPATSSPRPRLTNGSGQVDVPLAPGEYWVQESSAPAGWNEILTVAFGGGSNENQIDVPYARRYTVTAGNVTLTDSFVNRQDNGNYPQACGLSIALVFDRSGSISAGEFDQIQAAANSFVAALTGTPSSFAVYSFSDLAAQNLAMTSVAVSGQTVMNAINNLPATSGGTNWDAAFREVAGDGCRRHRLHDRRQPHDLRQ